MRAGVLRFGLPLLAAIVALTPVPLIAAAFGLMTFPIIALPPPSGPATVGTTMLTLAGRMPVQVWYPAQERGGARRAPYYLARVRTPLRARTIGALIRTGAFVDAPYAPGRFPVLLYSSAWGGTRDDNTAYAQDLASHGFVVVAMDDFRPSAEMDFSSEDASRRTIAWANKKVHLQAAVASGVIDALESLARDGAPGLAAHVDLDRIGMYGYSFGGAVAAQAALSDARIKAAANLDGWMFGDAAVRGVDKPYLLIADSAPGSSVFAPSIDVTEDPRAFYTAAFDRVNDEQIVAGFQRNGGSWLTIDETEHGSFSDAALLPKLLPMLRACTASPSACWSTQRVASAYLVAFFEHVINGGSAPKIDPAAGFNAHVAVWERPIRTAKSE